MSLETRLHYSLFAGRRLACMQAFSFMGGLIWSGLDATCRLLDSVPGIRRKVAKEKATNKGKV
jgi:hypothetical protein